MDLTPQQIEDEGKRLLDSPVLKMAIESMRNDAMTVLLKASGPDADATRREMADLINAVDGIKARIQAAVVLAQRQSKPRAQVA